MEQKKVTMDYKVLTEKISPDNVAVMAELIAMKETKILISYLGHHAEKAHKNLCRDIFGKHEPGYIFSDSYDFVQSVALFLCDHIWNIILKNKVRRWGRGRFQKEDFEQVCAIPGAWYAPPLNRREVTFLLSKILLSSST